MNDDRTSVPTGAAVLVVLALAVVLILVLEGRHVRPGLRLRVEMARVGNLQVGAKVRMAGLVLGQVDEIRLIGPPTRARLEVWIDRRHAWLLTETTDFFYGQEGLLGEPYLGVAGRLGAGGEPGAPLADGATVRGIDPPRIDALMATAFANLDAATDLMREGIPEGAALSAALKELKATLDGLDQPASAWAAGVRLWGEAQSLTEGVPEGSLGRIADLAAGLGPPPLGDRLERLGAQLDRIGARLGDPRVRRFAAGLGQAAHLVDGAERAIGLARELMAFVESGRGSLGAFMTDLELADEMKDMTRMMKRQPWKALFKKRR